MTTPPIPTGFYHVDFTPAKVEFLATTTRVTLPLIGAWTNDPTNLLLVDQNPGNEPFPTYEVPQHEFQFAWADLMGDWQVMNTATLTIELGHAILEFPTDEPEGTDFRLWTYPSGTWPNQENGAWSASPMDSTCQELNTQESGDWFIQAGRPRQSFSRPTPSTQILSINAPLKTWGANGTEWATDTTTEGPIDGDWRLLDEDQFEIAVFDVVTCQDGRIQFDLTQDVYIPKGSVLYITTSDCSATQDGGFSNPLLDVLWRFTLSQDMTRPQS